MNFVGHGALSQQKKITHAEPIWILLDIGINVKPTTINS